MNHTMEQYVVKRNGEKELVSFDKILKRIQHQCIGLDSRYINPVEISQKVISRLTPDITTVQLDEFTSIIAASQTTKHPDFAILAAKIAITSLHKQTSSDIGEVARMLQSNTDRVTGRPYPLLDLRTYKHIEENAEVLNQAIDYSRDLDYDYMGFKTLERGYLLRVDGRVVERPQHMLVRVAVGMCGADIAAAIETYHAMSKRYYTHATPTLFNAGTPIPQIA